jgi:hypothetical protein
VSAAPHEPDAVRDLAYYGAVPYPLVVESVERGGKWLRGPTLPAAALGSRRADPGASPALARSLISQPLVSTFRV